MTLAARGPHASELLDEGAARIERALDDAPEAKLRVLATLAQMYLDIGELEHSAQLRERRVRLAETRWGPDSR
jgi:serine/threonine-protein kinase